jgi:hypothetical protein
MPKVLLVIVRIMQRCRALKDYFGGITKVELF